MPLQPPNPDGRHAVWGTQERMIEGRPQGVVPLRFHDPVNAGQADVALAPLPQQALRKTERVRHIDGADADPEHIGAGRAGLVSRMHMPGLRPSDRTLVIPVRSSGR